MSDYRVAELVVPKRDSAYIDSSFTKKGNDFYCILPSYRKSITIKNVQLQANIESSILGCQTKIKWNQKGKNVFIDLSQLQPGDISNSGIFVIKLSSN